jgi:hypothetical protein
MNTMVMFFIMFTLNGQPHRAAVMTTSIEACLSEITAAETAIESRGGTVHESACVVRKIR